MIQPLLPAAVAEAQSSPVAIAAIAAVIPPLPEVDGAPAGALTGSFAVAETGAATYEIALAVPPGTGGLAPELKLVYESGGRGGLAGVGWSLEGLSGISRCPMTIAQDGRIDAVDFDADDRYCLDGKRMLAVAGSYGFDGTEYRTESESFTRVVSHGTAGGGPERFTAQMKNGLTYLYGADASSRFEAQGRDDVLFWQLDRIQDTAGNFLTVSYFENTASGETRPLRIDYTGNEAADLAPYNAVEFSYEPAPDSAPGYVAGSLLRPAQRLKAIRMTIDGALAWEYRLSYEQSPATGRSRLVQVEECGADGGCLAPTVFTWSAESQGAFGPRRQVINESGGWGGLTVLPGDFNGDGRTDLASVRASSNGYFSHIHLAREDGSFSPRMDGFHEPGGWNDWTFNPGDFNGDGRTDLSAAKADANGYRAWVNLARGDGTFHPAVQAFHEPGGWNDWTFLPRDYNGDGLTDFAAVKADANGYRAWIHLARPDGTFQPKVLAFNEPGGWNQWRFRPVDYNGDGRTDFAAVKADMDGFRFWINLANGDGTFAPGFLAFNEPGVWNDWTFRPGDFNGDGLTDFSAIKTSVSNGYRAYINFSRGDGTFAPRFLAFLESGSWDDEWGLYQEDFNGDGRTDFGAVRINANGYRAWLNLSRADGTFEPRLQAVNETGDWSDYIVIPGDYNGDGKTDLAAIRQRGDGGGYRGYVHLAPMGAVSQLVKITTGFGATTTVEYGSLTDSTLYTGDTDAVYPSLDVRIPFSVVSAYEQDDGIGGKARMRYRYAGLKADLHGRGFSGFRTITATDETRGLSTTTHYRQDHPFESMAFLREVRLEDGTLVQRSEDTWATTLFDHGGYFPYVQESVEENREIDGSLVNTTTTTRAFDDFGNATSVTVSQADGHAETTVSEYSNDVETWFLGRLTRAEVTHTAPGREAQTRASAFDYHPETGLLIAEFTEPEHPGLWLTKTYLHDSFGNIIQSTTVGGGVQARTHTTAYDARGQFAVRSVNAAGHIETRTYDRRHGKVATLTGPNNLTTAWDYDSFGRLRHEQRSDGTETRTLYLLVEESGPEGAVYQVRTDSSGMAPVIVYYDVLDREIRRETLGFDGERILTDRGYNDRGEVVRVSEPYFEGTGPLWTVSEYDDLGRLTRLTAPGGRVSSTDYAGLTTTVTNPLGQTSTRIVDGRGRVAESRDALNGTVRFSYDSLGNVTEIEDPAGNVTTMTYDLRGNRIAIDDPDSGVTRSAYNALGELLTETDAKGQMVRFSYDLLGRRVLLMEPEGRSTWSYDTRPHGIGRIASVQGPGGYSETYSYDDLGRPMRKTTVIAGESFSVTTGYDALSRVSTIADPTGFTVQNVYTDRGHLREVRNALNQKLYWRAESINARGQLERFTLGNQVRTERGFDATTGFLQAVRSVADASGGTVQDLEYRFDEVGNLLERADRLQGLAESFTYDALSRLTRAQVGGQDAVTLGYDAVGNILFKSDVGSYTYGEGGAGPHAVTSIAGLRDLDYGYDANGNRVTSSSSQPAGLPFAEGFESGDTSAWETAAPGAVEGEASVVTYSSFNMPTVIAAGGAVVSFQYGPDRGRFRKTVEVQGKRTTTLYVDGIYERESFEQGAARHKHYIAAGSALVAVHTTRSGEPDRTRYLHKDHLGSLDTVTDESGSVVERLSFDAWGRRRDAGNWRPAASAAASEVNRGYTGHEMLDEVGLIHMNGRVYDPEIGRFLSPDPVVQTPEDGQSLNRYSYVLNNPLSYTDPSGFFFKKLFEGIKKFFSGNKVGLIGAVVGITIGFWAAGGILSLFPAAPASISTTAMATQASSALFAAVGGGFAGGFAGSAASTLAAGGSLSDALRAGARGGAFGALSGGVFFTIGGLPIPKIVSHGVAGGALNLAQGGKFEHGFFGAAASALLAPVVDGLDEGRVGLSPLRTAAAAVVGGTVAEISGGSFANGAVTSAFARMFNEGMHLTEGIHTSLKSLLPDGGHGEHRYGVPNMICRLSESCNVSSLIPLALSNSVPGSEEIAMGIAEARAYGLSGGWVLQVVHYFPDRLIVSNITLPGHFFYPGIVTRTFFEANGNLYVYTIGEGTGRLPWFNEWIGKGLFKGLDERIITSVQQGQ